MHRYLIFNESCPICCNLARTIEQAAAGKLVAISLFEPQAREWLSRAYPEGWSYQPYLLIVKGEQVKGLTGTAMAVRLGLLLGLRKAWYIWNLARRYGVTVPFGGITSSPQRRNFLKQSTLSLASLLFVPRFLPYPGPPRSRGLQQPPPPPSDKLQPGVREFIADTYLAHAAEFPDPNETVEVLRLYLEGNKHLYEGQVKEALSVFAQAMQVQPDSRHALAGMGYALSAKYLQTQDSADLRAAANYFLKASETGRAFGGLHYTREIAYRLGKLGDREGLYAFFSSALATGQNPYRTHLHFAEGLAQLNDPTTEEWFQKALTLQPQDSMDAVAAYADWLLGRGQWERVLAPLSSAGAFDYLFLLRGVALERMGELDQARRAYARYAPLSQILPVPARYRIEGSVAQEGLVFEGDSDSIETHCITNISQCIYAEAEGESSGAKRAVGWTIRNRVFVDNPSNPCLIFGATGSTLCEKYISVINFNNAFVPCRNGCTRTPDTDAAAMDIYYGRTPEPRTGWCPNGTILQCDLCDPVNCRCSSDQTQGGRRDGNLYMVSDRCAPCPPQHPCCGNCTAFPIRMCANGCNPADNCFYRVP